jgi:two-component system, NtrC family, nitrogen regulation response regulator NtrX
MARERVSVVDGEPGVRSMLDAILVDEGYAVETAGSGEEGIAAAALRPCDAVLLDVWLPGIDGLETLSRLRAKGIDAEIVMISGHGTIDTAVKATKLGAYDFVEKPLSLEKTLLVLRNALRQRRLERRNRILLEQLARDTEILGTSASAERARQEAVAAAGSEAAVLICGEAGSGRETIARAIHARGRRAGEALVHVPCGALDEAGGGAILFGTDRTPGRLELAARGSLFFEDVDRLPGALQERLASWLSGHPDVRVLSSAAPEPAGLSSPLREHVDVIRIATVPLRKRREDIAYLAVHFLRDLSKEYGREEKTLAPDALAALTRHDWPGNVRAVRNTLERLVLLGSGPVLRIEDLPAELGGASREPEDLYGPFPTLAAGVAAFERYFVARVVREAHGDLDAAARRLGLTRESLRGKLS